MKKRIGGSMKKIRVSVLATLLAMDGIFGYSSAEGMEVQETIVKAATQDEQEDDSSDPIDEPEETEAPQYTTETEVPQCTTGTAVTENPGTGENVFPTPIGEEETETPTATYDPNNKGDSSEEPSDDHEPGCCPSNEPFGTPQASYRPTETPEILQTLPPVTKPTNIPEVPQGKPTICPTATQIVTLRPNSTLAPIVDVTKAPAKTLIPTITTAPPIITDAPHVVQTSQPEESAKPQGTGTPNAGDAGHQTSPTNPPINSNKTPTPHRTFAPDNSGGSAVCKINYVLYGGVNSAWNPTEVSEKEKSVTLHNPTRKGYLFRGWYTDISYENRVTSLEAKGASKVTLYAKWSKVAVATAKINSVRRLKNGKIRVRVVKKSGVKGYEYVYSTTYIMAKKTYVVSTRNPKDLCDMKRKVVYYIKVRSYKLDSCGRRVYGSYSKIIKCAR